MHDAGAVPPHATNPHVLWSYTATISCFKRRPQRARIPLPSRHHKQSWWRRRRRVGMIWKRNSDKMCSAGGGHCICSTGDAVSVPETRFRQMLCLHSDTCTRGGIIQQNDWRRGDKDEASSTTSRQDNFLRQETSVIRLHPYTILSKEIRTVHTFQFSCCR